MGYHDKQTRMTKEAWRTHFRKQLRATTKAKRKRVSATLLKRFRRSSEYRKARWVMFYLAFDGEVQTRPMIQQALADGKRVAVPITLKTKRSLKVAEITTLKRGLTTGPYGVKQPSPRGARLVAPGKLDLVVVPGLGFDRQRVRLGRGKGYFDRFLGRLSRTVPRIGLAYRFQKVSRLPRFKHDQRVTKVFAA